MKKITYLLFVVFCLIYNGVEACDYSFGTIEEEIVLNNDPSGTVLNTISSCGEYQFRYQINFTSISGNSVTDDITIHLPIGVTYLSLVSSSNGTALPISGTNDVIFHLDGWDVNSTFEIVLLCASPGCSASGTSGVTQLSGGLACATVNAPNGITLVTPSFNVMSMVPPSGLLKNIGDVDEIVYKIKNISTNGATIYTIACDFQLNSNLSPLVQNAYYLSTSATTGTGTNIYTYSMPSGVTPIPLPSNGTITIGSAEWQSLIGHSYLGGNEEIYLHIPYKVSSASAISPSDGIFDFSLLCGSTPCQQQSMHFSVSSTTAHPVLTGANVVTSNHSINANATFCAAAGDPDMIMDWDMYNLSAPVSGGPLGYGRISSLDLFLMVDNNFGSIDDQNVSLSSSAGTLSIPPSLVETVTTSLPIFGGEHTGTIYKIKLTELAVTDVGNWMPLGPNSLADLDGDGFIDDMVESGILGIHVPFTYNNTSCALSQTQGRYYEIARLEWHYSDAFGDPIDVSAIGNVYQLSGEASKYEYVATGAGGELTLPPDVLAGTDFVAELCCSPFQEDFTPGFSFDCPNGYHRAKVNVPDGYYLRTTGLTPSIPHPGWFELPPITAVSLSGANYGTASITPIVKQYCDGNGEKVIEVRFGEIPWDTYAYGMKFTYQIPCFDIPMYLYCEEANPLCGSAPSNFGFDAFNFIFDYVCDEACESCSAYIVGGDASTYHHCLGLCDMYFDISPNPVFKRDILGYNNPANGVVDCSDLTQPSNLNVNTEPTIDLGSAYPGDAVLVQAHGKFNSNPSSANSSFPTLIGNSYENIYLQIRYDDLLANERKEARIFDLDQSYPGDGITISQQNTTNSQTFSVSGMNMGTPFILNNVVHLNLNFPQAALDWMSVPGATYIIDVNVHLRVRSEAWTPTVHTFFSVGAHPLTSLRMEFKGTELATQQIDGCCDDYGANFRVLQPDVRAPEGVYSVPTGSTCDVLELGLRFYNSGAQYFIEDDFPSEFRPYGVLSPHYEVVIPAGFNYLGAHWFQDKKTYDASATGTNYFGTAAYLDLPISGELVTTDASGNTVVTFNGLDPASGCWPLVDLEKSQGDQFIKLKLQPTCEAPEYSLVAASGEYTLGVNQSSPNYQTVVPFDFSVPLVHYNAGIDVINPSATINATTGQADFQFSICNQALSNPYNISTVAHQAWIAFENSNINGLDLSTAVLTLQPSGTQITSNYTAYTANGNQAIIFNVGEIGINECVNFKLSADVNANGCVSGHDPVLDFVHVLAGNSCIGTPLTSPLEECQSDETNFSFNRFPSDMELILPGNAFPEEPVELCDGSLEYHFILNSSELGSVSDPMFWLDLPDGISLQDITFALPAGGTPTAPITSFDALTYGPGGDLGGWDILDHLSGVTSLPGTDASPNNQIAITLHLTTSCDYDLTSEIYFYAEGTSACGTQLETLSTNDAPDIENAPVISDLSIEWEFSTTDNATDVNCSNTGHVVLAVHNNAQNDTGNDLDVVATIPSGVFNVSNITPSGVQNGNTITWTIPSGGISAGGTVFCSFDIELSAETCTQDLPFSVSVGGTEDVSCASTGGSCEVELTFDEINFTIDACCQCVLDLSTSQTGTFCNMSLGTGTVTVNGGIAPYQYQWSPGSQTTQTAVGLSPGTYTVTVTDANGCTGTASVTVENQVIGDAIEVTATSETICLGESATLNLSGGSGYTIFDGTTTVTVTSSTYTVTPSQTTTYVVVGTNSCGCEGRDEITITVNPIPTITVNDATICKGQSTVLTASGADSYVWSPSTGLSATTGSSVTASPGITTTYTVTGTTNGCSADAVSTVTVNEPIIPTFNQIPEFCAGQVAPMLPTTSTNNITGTWNPSTVSNSASGTYTFTPNGNECATTTTMSITVNQPVEPEFDPVAAFCSGTTAPVLPTTSTNNITGTWDPSSVSNIASGTYTFTPNAGQCATATTMSITVNPTPDTPTITASGPVTFCQGSTLTLTSSAATGNLWSTGETTQSITVNSSGTYSVSVSENGCTSPEASITVTATARIVPTFDPVPSFCSGTNAPVLPTTSINNITGSWYPTPVSNTTSGTYTFTPTAGQCATTTTMSITVEQSPPTPVIVANGPTTFCSGGSVQLSAPTGYAGYVWSPGNETTSSITVTTSGSYSVIVINANGCKTSSAAMTVSVSETPSAPIITAGGPTTFCQGGSVTLNSSASTGNMWSTGETSQSIIVSSSGTYTVTTTQNGCTSAASASVTVTVNPVPTAPNITAGGPTTFCQGGSVTLNSSASTGNMWSTGETSQSIVVSSSGTYTVTTTQNGCTSASSASVTVTVNSVPTAPNITAGGPTTFCQGGSVILTSSATSGNYWSNGAITQSITVSSSGTYSVTTTQNGCTSAVSAPVTVAVNPVPNADFTRSNVACNYTFNATTPSGSGITYQWTINGTPVSSAQTFTQALIPGMQYTVCLTVSQSQNNVTCSASTCQTFTANCNVSFPCDLVADFTYVQLGNLNVQFISTSTGTTGGTTYLWDFGDGTTSTNQNPLHQYASQGTYTICLTVKKNKVCIKTICKTIVVKKKVIPNGPPQITVSPNPTNAETTIEISDIESGHLNVTVTDLLGAKVKELYDNADFDDESLRLIWDASGVQSGTYLIKVEVNGHPTVEKVVVVRM